MRKPYMLTAYRSDKDHWGLRDVFETESRALIEAKRLPAHWTFYRIYKLEP